MNFTQGKFIYSSETREQDFDVLTKALDASISGITLTDNTQPDSPIVYCNTAFEKLSGYARKEIIGHNCRFLQQDDRGQEARSVLKDAIKNGTECKVDVT